MNTKALLLFNGVVARLDRSALARRMETPRYRLDYERMMKREWISLDSVSEDDVNSFGLNVRMLIQDEPDHISIRRLAKDVYSVPEAPDDLSDRFMQAREIWQELSGHGVSMSIPGKQGNFKQGDLFDVLFYGLLAHLNPHKVDVAKRMTTPGAVSSFLCGWLMASLRKLLRTLRSIRDVNTELLR